MTKVHRIVLLVVDTGDLGAASVKEILENTGYANHCIDPQVVEYDTREVEWSDGHPLNVKGQAMAEFKRLFGKP